MSISINVDVLKFADADLYNAVVESLRLGPIAGIFEVSKPQWLDLPEGVRKRLIDYLRTVNPKADERIQDMNEHDAKTCGCPSCFQKQTAEHAKRGNERLKNEALVKAADARIAEYIAQGLANTTANREIFMKFLDEKFPGLRVITVQHVDAIVAAKRNELQWTPQPAPAPPRREPTVRTLANGEPELPLDADEATMRRSSIPQLKDLSKRRGEGKSWLKGGRPAGSFGANIDTGRQS